MLELTPHNSFISWPLPLEKIMLLTTYRPLICPHFCKKKTDFYCVDNFRTVHSMLYNDNMITECNFINCSNFSFGIKWLTKVVKGLLQKWDNMVFYPSPHWLLCEEPSFDINWVKHEGGREGGQQLDPTVNVTLVSPLHRCHRRFFFFHSFICTHLLSLLSQKSELYPVIQNVFIQINYTRR